MGTDIHLYVEKLEGTKWVSVDEWKTKEDRSVDVGWREAFYSGRSYDLFAILANVRNGRGFAGLDTGNGYNPISLPRGLPDDLSPEVIAVNQRWELDGHSRSYFSVEELLSYDWSQTVTQRGIVDILNYFEWDRDGRRNKPNEYCAGIGGGESSLVNQSYMKEVIQNIAKKNPDDNYWKLKEKIKDSSKTYCRVTWDEPYYRCSTEWWTETIPRLLSVGKPSEVRIVFWFDN